MMPTSPKNDVAAVPWKWRKMPIEMTKYTDFIGIINKAVLAGSQSIAFET
jgi:hypothetical protein